MSGWLADRAWPEVDGDSLLIVPAGSCEQHGPHLPLDTDTRIAVALATELAERIGSSCRLRTFVAPAVAIGASGEHQAFPGTLSIGLDAFESVVVELTRSALPPGGSSLPRPFRGVVFVNGHGGNIEAFTRALGRLSREGRAVMVWHPKVPGGDSHAGVTETSMMLHLHPDSVRVDRIQAGSTARWREIGDIVRESGLAAVTPNGVLGDPTGASASAGETIFDSLVADLCSTVLTWVDSSLTR